MTPTDTRLEEIECQWCGAVCNTPRPFWNVLNEPYCSTSHRAAANRALRKLVGGATMREIASWQTKIPPHGEQEPRS